MKKNLPAPYFVLITGCSSGIGRCAARLLKQRGYRVLATARRQTDVDDLRQEGLDAWLLDLAEEDSIAAAWEEIMAFTGGQLHGLFNNGAYGQPGAVEEIPREVLREQFETNVFGTHSLTCRAIEVMRRQGFGRIVQNSSVLGFVSLPLRGAYVASKFALEGLSDTLRLELMGSGVHVCLVEPGPIDSRFRINAYQAFQRHLGGRESLFKTRYQGMIDRLSGPPTTFTLPPEAVVERVIHALEAETPRARYRVTFPTWLFAFLKRILTTRMLDRILVRH
ncbi:MAG: SDR family NAD(P)-dependent oxidoreductase [Magnetococcales bacterium]|nr:SDR family NAD(P)-dependent oxidoreductase [Magnetococcales bacterium]NGZ26775.1 SDR family NAD(P)-dependent oxidoreductase [Magnetococcales bacterium]